jgi:hypothetical protein
MTTISEPTTDWFIDTRFTDYRGQTREGILTVGQLRAILADPNLDDSLDVVLDDGEGWFTNVECVIVPAADPDYAEWACVTLMRGADFDARQI